MKISTKGRYALRLMIDIGMHEENGHVSLKDAAERQDISMKYLERMSGMLCRAGLLESTRGTQGGYSLTKAPEEYTVEEILEAAEEDLHPVKCMEGSGNSCPRYKKCRTIGFWEGLDEVMRGYLRSHTLKDLMN
jgi:Rrf2 family protein